MSFKENVLENTYTLIDILDDNYYYFFVNGGALSAEALRIIADDLDRKNAEWDKKVRDSFNPTFNKDGCISDETYDYIKTYSKDTKGWLDFCEKCFDKVAGTVRKDGGETTFITGGWSNNECVISAMQENYLMWGMCWYSSTRGGHYRFEENIC